MLCSKFNIKLTFEKFYLVVEAVPDVVAVVCVCVCVCVFVRARHEF